MTSNSQKMLIVDDSKLSRMMIRGIAIDTFPELDIIEAANGDEAIEYSKGEDIDIMTIDFNMPGIDGIELAGKLKSSHPNARISLLTANVQDAISDKARNLGIGFIPKPINEEKVKSFLNAG